MDLSKNGQQLEKMYIFSSHKALEYQNKVLENQLKKLKRSIINK